MQDPSTSPSPPEPEHAAAGEEPPPPLAEWLFAALGLFLVVGSIVYLLVHEWTTEDRPPDPVIQIIGIERQGERFVVRLQVRNRSRTTAANLRIEGDLMRGDQRIERSETEFAFLPGGSAREAGLFFRNDPRQWRLELSARSYQEP